MKLDYVLKSIANTDNFFLSCFFMIVCRLLYHPMEAKFRSQKMLLWLVKIAFLGKSLEYSKLNVLSSMNILGKLDNHYDVLVK